MRLNHFPEMLQFNLTKKGHLTFNGHETPEHIFWDVNRYVQTAFQWKH